MAHQRQDFAAQGAVPGGLREVQRLDEVAAGQPVAADVVGHGAGLVGELGGDAEQLAADGFGVVAVQQRGDLAVQVLDRGGAGVAAAELVVEVFEHVHGGADRFDIAAAHGDRPSSPMGRVGGRGDQPARHGRGEHRRGHRRMAQELRTFQILAPQHAGRPRDSRSFGGEVQAQGQGRPAGGRHADVGECEGTAQAAAQRDRDKFGLGSSGDHPRPPAGHVHVRATDVLATHAAEVTHRLRQRLVGDPGLLHDGDQVMVRVPAHHGWSLSPVSPRPDAERNQSITSTGVRSVIR